jgi:ferredoxin
MGLYGAARVGSIEAERLIQGGIVRAVVDETLCQGHARCNAMAPEIFDLDDWGHARPGDHAVPPGMEEDAARAVRSCPELAISIAPDRADTAQ